MEPSTFHSTNPLTGKLSTEIFSDASDQEIATACVRSQKAFQNYRQLSGERRAQFLEAIADEILIQAEELTLRVEEETGYPQARIVSERNRTMAHFRMFATLLREGSWVKAILDTAQPNRLPFPKPDLRQYQIPIGPVGIFGASNFPQAYSTAGGDTASALAAGCSVIVKAHPAHPRTASLYAHCIQLAAKKTKMPEGVFQQIQGLSTRVGKTLVENPYIKAIGFTGSLRGGKALFELATNRKEPIPVYAEMGSTNPLFFLPDAIHQRKKEMAEGLVHSLTQGTGQMCTSPGLVIFLNQPESQGFVTLMLECLKQQTVDSMVHTSLKKNYDASIIQHGKVPGVQLLYQSELSGPHPSTEAKPALLHTTGRHFLKSSELHQEIFGPACMLIECYSEEEIQLVAQALGGQLTVSLHGTEKDLQQFPHLISTLEQKTGRLIFNGYPTGLEVGPATSHGGPYPATTFSHFTSVGTTSIYRFTRPICLQNVPGDLLPAELQDMNPLGILRKVDGNFSKDSI